jgi:hypothetical protein
MKSSNDSSAKSDSKLGVMQELEFPAWSGMSSRPIRLSFEQMLRHNEKLRLLVSPETGRGRAAARAQMHGRVRFINHA